MAADAAVGDSAGAQMPADEMQSDVVAEMAVAADAAGAAVDVAVDAQVVEALDVQVDGASGAAQPTHHQIP